MVRPLCHRVHTLAIVAILISILFPAIAASPASAEGEVCPEGQVYVPSDDTCAFEEDVPEGIEFIDEYADEQTDQSGEDLTDTTDDGDLQEEDADDTTEEQPEDAVDEEEVTDDMDGEDAAEEDVGEIKNLTLMTYSCPINWNPATRDILESHEMCTEPSVPDLMTYNILYEGELVVRVGVRTDTDLAKEGYPLKAGMWTIEEPLLEGLADPFAFCAIYDATGNVRLTVQEAVPGGKMDFLLAEGEELNCEWFSVAEVPVVVGDPNALPIAGFTVDGHSCPYGTDHWLGETYLLEVCAAKGVAAVEYTASLDGDPVSTQVSPTDNQFVDFQAGLDTRLLSGTWTISASLPLEYEKSYVYCTITNAEGGVSPVEWEPTLNPFVTELKPGEAGFCHWFTVESEPRSGTALGITLLLHGCPADANVHDGDYSTCTLPLQEAVSFDFIQNGQVVETGTAAAGATEVKFTANGGKPEAGEWTIRPSVPENRLEPVFSCSARDELNRKASGIDSYKPLDGGNGISAKFGPNLSLVCDVWLFSNDLSNSVIIGSRICPDDFDAANPAAGNRNATCPYSQFVAFTYSIDGGTVNQVETGRTGIFFLPAQAGQWRFAPDADLLAAQSRPLGVSLVSCDHTIAALNQAQTIEPTINTDGLSITIDLDEGDTLRCDFFLGPPVTASDPAGAGAGTTDAGSETTETDPGTETEGTDATDSDVSVEVGTTDDAAEEADSTFAGTSTITVQQWNCPEPFSLDEAQTDLMIACDASSANAALTLTDNLVSGEQTPEFGLASWTELEPGDISIGLAAPAGAAEPVVYCSSSSMVEGENIDIFPEQVLASGGAITITLLAESDVYCDWFNQPNF
jgi:hypothetical protein